MKTIINIQGKWYHLLLSSWGKVYLSKLLDIDNEVEKEGIVWNMQPFFYQNEVWYGGLFRFFIMIVRIIKKCIK